MVTIKSVDVYNVKTVTINTKIIPNTKEKFIGNNNSWLEEKNIDYIKQEMKI
jgi:hypothetical protein